MRGRTRRRLLRWGIVAGLVGLVSVFIVSFALTSVLGGRTVGSGGGTSEIVEGVGEAVPLESAGHVREGQTVSYSTTPPTSGEHWPSPASCGIYDEPVPDERVVHNMEHGHVIISHNLPDPDYTNEASRLKQLAEGLPDVNRWGIVRPYSRIDEGSVAMTAWGVQDRVQGVDEARIRRFYETYIRNKFSEETSRRGTAIPC